MMIFAVLLLEWGRANGVRSHFILRYGVGSIFKLQGFQPGGVRIPPLLGPKTISCWHFFALFGMSPLPPPEY